MAIKFKQVHIVGPYSRAGLHEQTENAYSNFIIGLLSNDYDRVEFYLKQGVNVNCIFEYYTYISSCSKQYCKKPPVVIAINNAKMIILLLKYNANINWINEKGANVSRIAEQSNYKVLYLFYKYKYNCYKFKWFNRILYLLAKHRASTRKLISYSMLCIELITYTIFGTSCIIFSYTCINNILLYL